MKIIFISGCYASESIELLRSYCRGKVGIQNASNVFQWSVIKGLFQNGADFEVVSYPLLPVCPVRFKKIYSPRAEIVYDGVKVGTMHSYCTVIGIKPFSIKKRLRRTIEQMLKTRKNEESVVLLLYGTNSFLTDAVIPIAKRYSNVKIAAIVTDLIDDAFNYKSNNTLLKRIQINREIKEQKSAYKFINKFILLTKAMEEKIPEAVGKNIVVEGVCDRILDENLPEKPNKDIKAILYTGTLQKYAGIDDFVDSFILTKKQNYRLLICGAGPSELYIKEKAEQDRRIIYKGLVSREEALALQQQATIVVNPRKPTESITRFSFPSKTIEYLSSGTPMMGYQLEGIPAEYYSHFYSPKDLNNESMAMLIDDVLQKPTNELRAKAMEARKFIADKKSAKVQIKKIIEFLKV